MYANGGNPSGPWDNRYADLPPADVLATGGDAQCFGSPGIELLDPSLHSLSVKQFFGPRHPVGDLGIRVLAIGLVDAPDHPLKSIGVTHGPKDTAERASLHPTPWTGHGNARTKERREFSIHPPIARVHAHHTSERHEDA